ncbi:NUDIX hydrolase [Paracoccus bogoriensis]|uniref:NUDIX hydrolase n=1 Tax=Paracoccus bogoriensis TaxID=242065 RepID=UPI001C6811B0|nr:NUDIX hydrolase [Paracoccus bogoriensis]MBW7056193.1 NUDIX hydrolase [Paracoccus bogoriensis]
MNALVRSLRLVLGRRPPAMQVGAVCRDPVSGDVALVTSRDTGRWVIPKGWPMAGRSLSGAAAQEAWEEAGLRGHVHNAELGRYRYDKTQDAGFAIPVETRVFLLDVTEAVEDFPEACQRRRRWFAPEDAARMVAEPGLKRILLALPPVSRG